VPVLALPALAHPLHFRAYDGSGRGAFVSQTRGLAHGRVDFLVPLDAPSSHARTHLFYVKRHA
jgi:hypothetical protein